MKKEQIVITRICVEVSDFVSFLEKYDAKDAWLEAFVKYRNASRGTSIECILKEDWGLRWDKLIVGAFPWEPTPEGHDYWNLVDKLWNEFLVKNKVENAGDSIVPCIQF